MSTYVFIFFVKREGFLIILGIDPGLATVGYGLVQCHNSQLKAIDYGTIDTEAKTPFPERLEKIYQGVQQLIELFHPDIAAFEELFFYNNITTAIAVSQARGVALLAAQQNALPLYEYTPMQIKQSVTGYGHAKKAQVQEMVKILLGLKTIPKPDDAADALAVAICRSNATGLMQEQFRIG